MKRILVVILVTLLFPSFCIGKSVASNTYVDSETNIKFNIPTNWIEKELSKDREYIDVKFVSSEAKGMSILYGSTDIWSEMSPSDRAGYSRSNINNSMFTNTDIAEMTSTSTAKVKKVTYNDVQCFQAESTTISELYGVKFTTTMTHVIYYDNGWAYWFQFSGDSNNEYFSDFKSLLNTVTFPKSDVNNSNPKCNSVFVDYAGAIVSVILILAVIVGALIFVVAKNRSREKIESTEKNFAENQTITSPESVCQCCRKCGTKLSIDSLFCYNCGTKKICGGGYSMKVLIWVICFLLNAIITTIVKERGIILGAVPMVILYGVTIWLARTLCKKWDKRKTDKTLDTKSKEDDSTSLNSCDLCGRVRDETTPSKKVDEIGVSYRNLCDKCVETNNETLNKNTEAIQMADIIQKNVTNAVSPIRFCRKCGVELIGNSRFCRKCGTEIVKG